MVSPKLLKAEVDEIEDGPAEHRISNLHLNIQLILLSLLELLHLSKKNDELYVVEHQINYLINREVIFSNNMVAAFFHNEVVEAHVTDLCWEERVKWVYLNESKRPITCKDKHEKEYPLHVVHLVNILHFRIFFKLVLGDELVDFLF